MEERSGGAASENGQTMENASGTMKIYFCDICNESVPQGDLDGGRAFFRKDRVICSTCDRAMGGGDPAPGGVVEAMGGPGAGATPYPPMHSAHSAAVAGPPAPSGGVLGVVMASLAILLTAGVSVLLFERMDQGDRQVSQDLGLLRSDLSLTVRDVRASIDQGQEQGSAERGRFAGDLAEIRARLEERARGERESAERARGELERIVARLGALEPVVEDVARHERELRDVARAIAEIQADLRLVAEKVLEIEERGPVVAAPVEEDSTPAPPWMHLVDQLASESSGARWSAVQALGDTGDPAVAEHLVPMLADRDIFVRMATARVLGDLSARVGVGPLIDSLGDPEASVREAAVVALRAITAKNFRFDPAANEAERAKRIKVWREWWEKEG